MSLFGYTVNGFTLPFSEYNVGDGIIADSSYIGYDWDLFERGFNQNGLI